ncbi:MAG: hypothetical protein CUN49_02905 [Candidatus Thermofonsia Clade 1 bacterium]|jgi:hypothetical protein|uniref:Uncharacterized protein n=1 Tax=Candidatus Thermofonsia Clade 1 bacterium TaxID=2364210 RepID=A0A2M8PHA8_9CHLR|nr:MAG: hypothetical protein CUN49_02905 [Candidatus Thermofonsia Clade 1 bacterium]RMF51253.1 MAG: hypothetical protein D6749_08375 [Chloroflexota bacterium]
MYVKFERGRHGWHYTGSWFKPMIGIFILFMVFGFAFNIFKFALPAIIFGFFIFFFIRMMSAGGMGAGPWEAWRERTKGYTDAPSDSEPAEGRPKRKNDEDVLDIEDDVLPEESGKPKRRLDEVEYL